MIEGLKIDLSSSELKDHLSARAKYHIDRADWYDGQVDALKKGGLRPVAVTNDPVNSLEQTADRHRKKAAYFRFVGDHIIQDETYRLRENELEALEIFERLF